MFQGGGRALFTFLFLSWAGQWHWGLIKKAEKALYFSVQRLQKHLCWRGPGRDDSPHLEEAFGGGGRGCRWGGRKGRRQTGERQGAESERERRGWTPGRATEGQVHLEGGTEGRRASGRAWGPQPDRSGRRGRGGGVMGRSGQAGRAEDSPCGRPRCCASS